MDTIAFHNDETLATDHRWVCAFCGRVAVLETVPRPLCLSKTCACGAIVLANRPCDSDEITDDAIALFSVEIRPESRGWERDLRQDILRSGVEFKLGTVCVEEICLGYGQEIQYVWFRRQKETRPVR